MLKPKTNTQFPSHRLYTGIVTVAEKPLFPPPSARLAAFTTKLLGYFIVG